MDATSGAPIWTARSPCCNRPKPSTRGRCGLRRRARCCTFPSAWMQSTASMPRSATGWRSPARSCRNSGYCRHSWMPPAPRPRSSPSTSTGWPFRPAARARACTAPRWRSVWRQAWRAMTSAPAALPTARPYSASACNCRRCRQRP
ncbi:hypothetical protein SDC9_175481 [bioreactor metagenome]|uniref:Uncharacterized protein n=1 Tax=bioreactor metagenome TaxID=1076179 RepID=A0A645GWL0_9ZZZZ